MDFKKSVCTLDNESMLGGGGGGGNLNFSYPNV